MSHRLKAVDAMQEWNGWLGLGKLWHSLAFLLSRSLRLAAAFVQALMSLPTTPASLGIRRR